MRIYGPNATTFNTPANTARRTGSSEFTLPETTETAEARATAAPRGVSSIDALLALQGVEDPLEKRKRSVKRGKVALDVLDDLKLGLLSGSLNASTLARLRAAAADLK